MRSVQQKRRKEKYPPTNNIATRTIGQSMWSWNVLGNILGVIAGGGYFSFMTSGHAYIADMFLIPGILLTLYRFLSWELLKNHQKKKFIYWIAIFVSFVIMAGAISLNHYLNRQKHTKPFVQILIPRIVESPEYSTVEPGKQLAFNVEMANVTSERVFNVVGRVQLCVVEHPDANSNKAIMNSHKEKQDMFNRDYEDGKLKSGPELGINQTIWGTAFTGPLSESQCKGLFDGSTRIYVAAWTAWKDGEQRTDTSFGCKWLQPLPKKNINVYTSKELVWHNCAESAK